MIPMSEFVAIILHSYGSDTYSTSWTVSVDPRTERVTLIIYIGIQMKQKEL